MSSRFGRVASNSGRYSGLSWHFLLRLALAKTPKQFYSTAALVKRLKSTGSAAAKNWRKRRIVSCSRLHGPSLLLRHDLQSRLTRQLHCVHKTWAKRLKYVRASFDLPPEILAHASFRF
jgi:hypothetical protein